MMPGESERMPCEGWRVAPSGNGWSGNVARRDVLGHAMKAVENVGAGDCFWAVYEPGNTTPAVFGHAPTLAIAQLAAESAAASLLVSALLALGETGREAMRKAMEGRK